MKCVECKQDQTGVTRTHANRNNRQEQPRVWTREGRPVCDICGRVGHVRQNCYARVDQRNQYQNPENTQPRTQSGPRITALEAEDTAEQVVAQFEHHKLIRCNQSSLNGDIGSTYPEHNSTIKAEQSKHDAQSYNDLVSVADSYENNAVENVIQDSQVQETAETATKEPLASNSQTQEPTAKGPSSPEIHTHHAPPNEQQIRTLSSNLKICRCLEQLLTFPLNYQLTQEHQSRSLMAHSSEKQRRLRH